MAELMYETQVEIRNPDGLHMRPAMQFVDAAGKYESDIKVGNGQIWVDGKSIMQMTMLAATHGTRLTIRAEGPGAKQAVKALAELIETNFVSSPPETPAGEKDTG